MLIWVCSLSWAVFGTSGTGSTGGPAALAARGTAETATAPSGRWMESLPTPIRPTARDKVARAPSISGALLRLLSEERKPILGMMCHEPTNRQHHRLHPQRRAIPGHRAHPARRLTHRPDSLDLEEPGHAETEAREDSR